MNVRAQPWIHIAVFGACMLQCGSASARFETQPVEFSSFNDAQSTRLTGMLFRPDRVGTERAHPAVVIAHGCSGMYDAANNLSRGIQFWSEHLVQQGFVVLAVDSFGSRGQREICTQKNRPILESRERPRDAYGALLYLAKLDYVIKEKVFLLGFSNGATGTLYALEESGEPYRLAKKAGVTFVAGLAFYPGCTSAERRRYSPGLPLAIFMGALDDWTPAEPCKQLVHYARQTGKYAVIYLYAGAFHGFDVPGAKVRVRRDVRMGHRPGLGAGVHVGGNDNAREYAVKDVDAFMRRYLD